MKITFKKISVFTFVLVGVLFLNGCQTMAGLGKDVQQGGKNLEKAAKADSSENNKNNN